ncbi:MAG: hypothetical protein SWE60_20565 [Thermodesulfobacteriota bacterium]|nr:hypothetical protein [Thermodesulfobacteriota bacterium]
MTRYGRLIRSVARYLVAGAVLFCGAQNARAWELGTKIGFDTNINRSVDNEEADSYMAAYGLYKWEPVLGGPLTWKAAVSLEGMAYSDFSDLNCAVATISPGLTYRRGRKWEMGLHAFLEGKGVRDEDQSALTFGAKVSLHRKWRRDHYIGAYYVFADSHAEADTYSFSEHSLGAFVGRNWTPWFFGEISYEFASGDSFRAVDGETVMSSGQGAGRHRARRRYSQAFGTDVIRESVDQHTIGADLGFDVTASFFLWVSYSFSSATGDLGTSTAHAGFAGIGYAF